jgi:hypothetical protein
MGLLRPKFTSIRRYLAPDFGPGPSTAGDALRKLDEMEFC